MELPQRLTNKLSKCYVAYMARVFFDDGQQKSFLEQAQRKTGFSFKVLAQHCGGHPRSYSDWLHEKASLPQDVAAKLARLANISLPAGIIVKEDFWYTKKAGQLGGLAHLRKYGNPGTPQGRALGGMRSLVTHKRINSNFTQRKFSRVPRRSAELAEMCGIILGDGNISYHQISVTLNRKTDAEYVQLVLTFMKKLFGVDVTLRQRDNTSTLVVTGVGVVECLLKHGLQRGNKIRKQVDIPLWIKENALFAKSCVRGLLDTDGSVYFDRHNYGGKIYQNICLAFTSYSQPLLNSVYNLLLSIDVRASLYHNNLKVRRKDDVYRYHEIVGSRNAKHLCKLKHFFS